MLKAWGIVIPGVLLVGATALRVSDPVPIQEVRNLVFDNYQRMQPRIYDKELPVRIADIDEKSLAKFGQWPWSRSVLAKLVDRLNELGAAVIAFDVILAEPDRLSPQSLAETLPDDPAFAEVRHRIMQLPDPDTQLSNSIAKAPTVLGFAMLNYDPKRPETKPKPIGGFTFVGDNPLYFVHGFDYVVGAMPQFQTVAVGNGAVNSDPDPDGVVRRVPLVLNYRGNIANAMQSTDGLLPSLTLESIRSALQAQTYTIRSTGANNELGSTRLAYGVGAIRIEGSPVIIKPNRAGEILLDDTGHQSERFISIADLFDPSFPRDSVQGRIILVGTSVEGLKDMHSSPLSFSIPGVELHAEAIEQILATALTGAQQLQRPYWSDAAEITYLIAFGMLAIAFAYRAGALSGLLVAGIAVVVAFGGSLWLFQHQRLLVDPLYPAGTAVILVMA
ncbi:MAG TPA: CHASE2 domain-containing protein, partial [Candidatus Binatia bacterium]|nr:CHASE2 domain-containing protein [Candidatus Binatia bacterium]